MLTGTDFRGETYEFHNNMLIAADMILNVEDRRLIYAVMYAAEKATLGNANPRKVFMEFVDEFPHIELDMGYKNWDLDDE